MVELISQAIADISTAEFIVNETPSEGESGLLNGWTQQANLRCDFKYIFIFFTIKQYLYRYGTLLAHACQSSLILGQHPDLVPCGGSFGREIALAWQVCHISLSLFSPSAIPITKMYSIFKFRPIQIYRVTKILWSKIGINSRYHSGFLLVST